MDWTDRQIFVLSSYPTLLAHREQRQVRLKKFTVGARNPNSEIGTPFENQLFKIWFSNAKSSIFELMASLGRLI